MSLSEAREQAETVLMQLRRGEDPRVRPVAADMTFGAVAEAFIARYVSKLRNSAKVKARKVAPHIAERVIAHRQHGVQRVASVRPAFCG
jgi:hypothetical protein